ncbi:hypothetical protein [Flavilitoribacter nigricans]|uniref:Uncharacterized protein n=1 Tax=Flavilitoribacter nigricans (strain ATCC 23147 / DSM 23189 / NBRC 102662 / NCIMB 1420 / SS-2) TaxID=1122177 RepID=A0A2D0MWV7_FLAN2|nr:hypothetical protein [Flavilitoribacter nigricans]PHN00761.1 hypothetical protein CRP01_40590 [Flavilitoribacter nigricans DSM 23189 = NBRC 102662]
MSALQFKNPVLSHLDGHKGTGRQATVRPLPDIHTMVDEKSLGVQSADPQPSWQETVPKGRQMWFTVGMVIAALIVFYFLLKQKVIKI